MIQIEVWVAQTVETEASVMKIALPAVPRVGDRLALDHLGVVSRVWVRQVEWLPERPHCKVILRCSVEP